MNQFAVVAASSAGLTVPALLAHTVGQQVGRVPSDLHREHGAALRTGVTVTAIAAGHPPVAAVHRTFI
ncbi:hypothetical protein AB0392_27320 [Nonomuraea angiospora]|uniref:hypothetical protein n=1 Tax=Nonomuraea angiospora TaxID=46172 RepID=UPI00344D9772